MDNLSTQENSSKEKKSFFTGWDNMKSKMSPPARIGLETLEFIFTLLILLIIIRQGFFERRYIPSESMLPNLQIEDQLIIEKVSKNLHKVGLAPDLQRGDIIVFYPPPEANYGVDIKKDFPNTFVRLTGLSSDIEIAGIPVFFFLPKAEDAYIKRIVGLPGETIEVKAGDGVYINGRKLIEDYIMEAPDYSVSSMSDIPMLSDKFKNNSSIVVPPDHYFVLGDNRNNSNDGHIWGFVKKDRIVGRAYSIIWRDLGRLKPL